MLGVDIDEVFTQALEELKRGRGVVDESTALTLGCDLTAYDAFLFVAVDIFFLEHSPDGSI